VPFLKPNNVGRHFYPDFQGFCQDFQQIKTFGGALVTPASPPPTLLLFIARQRKIQIRLLLNIIRIQNFIFVLWKFLQMSELLCNVLKVSGSKCPKCLPTGCAPKWICSNAYTCLKNQLLVRVWPMYLSVKIHLRRLLFHHHETMRLGRICSCRLVGMRLNRFVSDIWVNTECKAFGKPAWCSNSSELSVVMSTYRSTSPVPVCAWWAFTVKKLAKTTNALLLALEVIPGVCSSCF